MMRNDPILRARERLTVTRLGKSAWRETDKDLAVIADLVAEVKRLRSAGYDALGWQRRCEKAEAERDAAREWAAWFAAERAEAQTWVDDYEVHLEECHETMPRLIESHDRACRERDAAAAAVERVKALADRVRYRFPEVSRDIDAALAGGE